MMRCPAHSRRRVRRPARRIGLAGALAVSLAILTLQLSIVSDADAREENIRVGGGCILIDEAGTGTVAVGDCGHAGYDPGSAEDAGQQTSPPEGTTPKPDGTEETSPEETLPEETGPEHTFAEETTEQPAPEETTAGGEGACPADPPDGAVPATVARAIDGDTLELEKPVEGAGTVRLIGVDSPELEGEDGRPQPGAEEATAFTAGQLEGRKVLLQFDRERRDGYGRLLAYVWVADSGAAGNEDGSGPRSSADTGFIESIQRLFARVSGRQGGDTRSEASGLFNLALVEEGHAKPLAVEPNTLYADCFERAAGEPDGAPDEGGAAEEQYEGSPPEATVPETTSSGPDEQEQTVPEEPGPEPTSAEEPPAAEQYEQENPPEEAEPEEDEPEKLSAPAPDEGLCPAPKLLDGAQGSDAKATLPFATEAGAILLAYAAAPADDGVEGGVLGLSVLDEGGSLVGEPIAFQREGAELAFIEVVPGDYRVEIGPANRRYVLDVYECAGVETRQDAPEPSPAQGEYLSPPAAELPATESQEEEPPARPVVEPVEEAAPPAGGWGLAPKPGDTLAVQETPEGPVPVLPDTGGPFRGRGSGGVITLALGCAMFSLGVLLFVSLRQAERRTGRRVRSGGDRERL